MVTTETAPESLQADNSTVSEMLTILVKTF